VKKHGFIIILLMVCLCANAQIAREMDTLLEEETVTTGQAARFVLSASGKLGDSADADTAFKTAQEQGWLPPNAQANDPILLSDLSLLVMGSFGLEGGLMYRILPGPRYAYRELRYRRIIQGSADPSQKVSGDVFFLIVNRVLALQEE
jgi:hypothetical protein